LRDREREAGAEEVKILRSFLLLALLLVLIGIGTNVCDDRCSKNVSADETAGMVQAVPFAGGKQR